MLHIVYTYIIYIVYYSTYFVFGGDRLGPRAEYWPNSVVVFISEFREELVTRRESYLLCVSGTGGLLIGGGETVSGHFDRVYEETEYEYI